MRKSKELTSENPGIAIRLLALHKNIEIKEHILNINDDPLCTYRKCTLYKSECQLSISHKKHFFQKDYLPAC